MSNNSEIKKPRKPLTHSEKEKIVESRIARQNKIRKEKRSKIALFSTFSILAILAIVVGLAIFVTTKDNYNSIERSKVVHNTITKINDANDTKESVKNREKFLSAISKVIMNGDDTDIKKNAKYSDLEKAKKYISGISAKYQPQYNQKYNELKSKIDIQNEMSKFFSDDKTIADNIKLSDIYAFNKKYNSVLQQFSTDSSDTFAERINTQQLELTNDAQVVYSIYDNFAKMFNQLGDNSNGWTFKLKDNVVPDQKTLPKQYFGENQNASSVISLSSINEQIKTLNFDWSRHFSSIQELLSKSVPKATTNAQKIIANINQQIYIQQQDEEKKRQEEYEKQQSEQQQENNNTNDNNSDSNIIEEDGADRENNQQSSDTQQSYNTN